MTEPIKALVVDDDPVGQNALASSLAARGFEVRTAASYGDAMCVIENHVPSLVVTVWRTPEVDGAAICRHLRSADEPTLPYIMVVLPRSNTADCPTMQDLGADDYILTPLDESEVAARLRSATRIIRSETYIQDQVRRLQQGSADAAVLNARLHQLAAELEESRRQADTAQSTRTAFLADVSHEIRSPMTAILGFAEMLYREGDLSKAPSQRLEAIDAILRNCQYLLDVVNDVLDLSKLEAGKMDVESVPCRPARIVEEVRALLAVRAQAKKLAFHLHLDSIVPPVVRTDPLRLKQILVNLVGNAIKFTEKGEVGIAVSFQPTPCSGRMQAGLLRVDVTDTGTGIKPEYRARLFQRFGQAESSITRRHGGTGLGLTISKQLANLMGGDIAVVSRPGEGSTFSLSITVEECAELEAADRNQEEATSRTDCAIALDGVNILLVEDCADARRLIESMLAQAGADVMLAENGTRAVELALAARAAGRPVDVVLMDVQLPNMDGCEAVRLLRQQGYHGVVIGMTASSGPEERRRCLASGCQDFVSKPIQRQELIDLVRHLVRPIGRGHGEPTSPARDLVSELAHDADMTELVEEYVAELPDRLAAIRGALDQHDLETLQKLVHQLKGSAGGYGFPSITRAARDLEEAARVSGDVEILLRKIEDLASLCERARALPSRM